MSGTAPWEELSQEGGTSGRKEVGQAQYPQLHLALEPMDRWTGGPHMDGGQALCFLSDPNRSGPTEFILYLLPTRKPDFLLGEVRNEAQLSNRSIRNSNTEVSLSSLEYECFDPVEVLGLRTF